MASVADLLVAVDERPPGESGAFLVDGGGGAISGSVFVEAARVCWAAVSGQRGRLRYLLRRNSERPLDDAELDDAFAECRSSQRALSELLIERGLVSDDGLRTALRQHTVESLLAQCDGSDHSITWVPHRQCGYHARHTFSPIELLTAAGAMLYPSELAHTDLGLLRSLPAQTACAFAIGDDDEPVAVWTTSSGRRRVRDLLVLGDWVAAALAVCNGFSSPVMQRAVASVTDAAVLGWRSARRLVQAAVIDEPGALSDAVAELARRRLPAVVSSRIPLPQS